MNIVGSSGAAQIGASPTLLGGGGRRHERPYDVEARDWEAGSDGSTWLASWHGNKAVAYSLCTLGTDLVQAEGMRFRQESNQDGVEATSG